MSAGKPATGAAGATLDSDNGSGSGAEDARAGTYFATGGTMRPDDPSYVARRADQELYEALVRGQYCYLLSSRQMGKSSLAIRTRARLREEAGCSVAFLDLTTYGALQLTPEQWYGSMGDDLAKQLNLDDEADDYMDRAGCSMGPLQCWIGLITEVALPRVKKQLVILIDEIDFARSLPFGSDDLFAAIRACYNRRALEPALNRLNVCLLGVASPSDLIRDVRTTPFNIGRRVELTDFTLDEAAPLARGLGTDAKRARQILARVLYWTGGQPYLTQRLCHEIAQRPAGERSTAGVDRACQALFLSRGAQGVDDNLVFVRDRILGAEVDLPALLDLYRMVRGGQRVAYDEANPLTSVLRISGVVKVVDGYLQVRNRIYERVFDAKWVRENLPGQELRRQRQAQLRGVLSSIGLVAVVSAATVFYSRNQLVQARRDRAEAVAAQRAAEDVRDKDAADVAKAREDAGKAEAQLAEARKLERSARRMVQKTAVAQYHVVTGESQALAGRYREAAAQFAAAYEAFVTDGASPVAADLGLAALYAVAPPELGSLPQTAPPVLVITAMPGGRQVLTAAADGKVRLWDVPLGREVRTFTSDGGGVAVQALAVSEEGKTVWAASDDGHVRAWGAEDEAGKVPRVDVQVCAPSPRCRFAFAGGRAAALLVSDGSGALAKWDLTATPPRKQANVPPAAAAAAPLAVLRSSPDGRAALAVTESGALLAWDLAATEAPPILLMDGGPGSSSGKYNDVASCRGSEGWMALAVGEDRAVRLWEVRSGTSGAAVRSIPTNHAGPVVAVASTADGRCAITADDAGAILVHDLRLGGQPRKCFLTPADGAGADVAVRRVLAFGEGANGALISSCADDGQVRFWNAPLRGDATMAESPDADADAPSFWVTGADVDPSFVSCSADFQDGAPMAIVGRPSGARSSTQPAAEVWIWDAPTRRLLWKGRPLAERQGYGALALREPGPDGAALGTFVDRSAARGAASSETTVVAAAGPSAAEDPADHALTFVTSFQDGKPVRANAAHRGNVAKVQFAPRADSAASAGADHAIGLWNCNTGELLRWLRGHGDRVSDVTFSGGDGRWIASCSFDGTTKLWDAESGEEVRTFPRRHDAGGGPPDGGASRALRRAVPVGVALSPAEDLGDAVLLTAFSDGVVEMWDFGRPAGYRRFARENDVEAARSVLRRDANDAAALSTLGEWYAFRGMAAWAATLLERAKERGAKVGPLDLARCYWQSGRPTEAAQQFQLALDQEKRPAAQVYLKLCLAAVRREQGLPSSPAAGTAAATRPAAAGAATGR